MHTDDLRAGQITALEGHVLVTHLLQLQGRFHAHGKVFREPPASLHTARGALCRLSSAPHPQPEAACEDVRLQAQAFILARLAQAAGGR